MNRDNVVEADEAITKDNGEQSDKSRNGNEASKVVGTEMEDEVVE